MNTPAPTPATGLTTRPAAGTNLRSVAWMDDALCAQVDPDLWFPENGDNRVARELCDGCPVLVSCSAHITALEAETPGRRRFGTWAGRTGATRTAATPTVFGDPVRDGRILRMVAQGWEPGRIAAEVLCDERTVMRVVARAREAS